MYASALAVSRTRHEIDAELFRLYQLIRAVPMLTAFGDNNHDAIRAQIAVLRGLMTTDEAVERYEDGHDYLLAAALDAVEWLRDTSEPLSLGWQRVAAA